MRVYISNSLEILAKSLKNDLLNPIKHPFTKKWVVVPNKKMGQNLLTHWVFKGDEKIISGFYIISWQEIWNKIFPNIPSAMELSFQIETVLKSVKEEKVLSYIREGGDKRKGSFCTYLAEVFLVHAANPKEKLLEWQKEIWEMVFTESKPLYQQIEPFDGSLYFFDCWDWNFYQREALKKIDAVCFLFSPCSLYWGDFRSFREQQFLLYKAHENRKDVLRQFFNNDHPLLGNLGKRGREVLSLFEEEECLEQFAEAASNSLLGTLQNELLLLTSTEHPSDSSIQIHSAVSKIAEVELVCDEIERSLLPPSEIIILVSDIEEYASAIELTFQKRKVPYLLKEGADSFIPSPLMQGLKVLLDLPKERFRKESVEKLLFLPLFINRFQFSFRDTQALQKWFSLSAIRCDLEGHPSSWQKGLFRLSQSLKTAEELALLDQFHHVIKLFSTELLQIKEKKTIGDWGKWLEKIIQLFFQGDEIDNYIQELREWHKFHSQGVFSFSSIERLLPSSRALYKNTEDKEQNLEVVTIESLDKGTFLSAKVIILMGMQENNFPKSKKKSLLQNPGSSIDDDRYLFLEIICQAQISITITYTRVDCEDGKIQKPSSLIQELCRYCTAISITHHPYIGEDQYLFTKKEREIKNVSISKSLMNVFSLKKLANDPLLYFFEEGIGVRPEFEILSDEFTFQKTKLACSLYPSQEIAIETLRSEGKLPSGPFETVACIKIEDAMKKHRQALTTLGVRQEEIYSIELQKGCSEPFKKNHQHWIYPAIEYNEILLEGKVDNITHQGLICYGSGSLEELVQIWPFYIIVNNFFKAPLLLLEKSVVRQIDIQQGALARYIGYAQTALRLPSPLFPKYAQSILKNGKIPAIDDNLTIQWAKKRGTVCFDELFWVPYLQEVFREIL
jgi:exodeoxyribonuclease V gamma subunit